MKKLLTLAGVMAVAAMAVGTTGCGSSSTTTQTTTPPTTQLTYVSRQSSNSGDPILYTLNPTTGVSTQVAIPINPVAAFVSSNSAATEVIYTYENESGVYDVFSMGTDGTEVQLTTGQNTGSEVFSPDGKTIAYWNCAGVDDCTIFTMNADGSNQQAVFATPGYFQDNPWFSPDGTTIALYIGIDCSCDDAPANFSRGGGRHTTRSVHGRNNAAVHPDGGSPSYTNGWYTMTLSNPTPTLVYATNDYWGPSTFTTDGTKLLMTVVDLSSDPNVYSINLDGSGLTPLTVSVDAPDFAPVEFDGQIYFNRYDTADNAFDIYSMAPDGSAQTLFSTSAPDGFETLIDTYFID